jgi:glycosyltransferase involved in cell wall biosynthesis
VKIAYVVIMYPRISHTFVQNEVWGLRQLGVDVSTISIRTADDGNILSERDRTDAEKTHNILPLKPSTFLRSHVATFLRHPLAVLATAKQAITEAPRSLRAKIWSLFYVLEALVVWQYCRKNDIRHVHAHFANVGSDVALLATSFGNRVDPQGEHWTWSFTMHGPTEFGELSRFGLAHKAASADAVVCISDFCKSQLMALTPATAWSRMHIVHCGIDVDRFRATSRAPHDSPIGILCVGRLVSVKAQRLLVESVAAVLSDGIEVALTLVGDGPDRRDLEQLVADLGISDSVTFAGGVGQDDILAYYRDADIFCLPSFAEGLPVVLMEAMANALPVVTTQIAGIPELVRNGESGLIVPPGNAEALTDALRLLVTDASMRTQFGQNGRRVVEQEFNVEQTSKQLFEVLQNVDRHPEPRR